MRLLLVELKRLFARRFFWIGAVSLLFGIAVVLGITAAQSQVPSAAELASAQQQAEAQEPAVRADRERCEEEQRDPAADGPRSFPPGFDCDQIVPPTADQFLADQPFRFVGEMNDRTQVLTIVLALFAFLVGATAVGAEWHHGTLAGLLLWEPRRLRVFLAKFVALAGGVTVLGVLGYVANVAGHWAIAEFRGVVGAVTADFQRELALTAARGLAATLAAAAAGFAIAFTLRRTAAAMGVAIAYFGVVEIGTRVFFQSNAEPFLLTRYTEAWLFKGAEIWNYDCSAGGGECSGEVIRLATWHGGAYLGGVALILLVVAAVLFRRREVT